MTAKTKLYLLVLIQLGLFFFFFGGRDALLKILLTRSAFHNVKSPVSAYGNFKNYDVMWSIVELAWSFTYTQAT